MALTMLDPKTAPIVIDLQKGIVGVPTAHPIGGVLKRSRLLADAFRVRGMAVVLVNVTGNAPGRTEQPRRDIRASPADFADLVPELGHQLNDILITKRTWGAFASSDLESQLRTRGVTQVVICGIATGTGVEATARQAYEQGFNVTLAIDAMTDTRDEAHDYSIRNVFPRLGETGSADGIIALLERRS